MEDMRSIPLIDRLSIEVHCDHEYLYCKLTWFFWNMLCEVLISEYFVELIVH